MSDDVERIITLWPWPGRRYTYHGQIQAVSTKPALNFPCVSCLVFVTDLSIVCTPVHLLVSTSITTRLAYPNYSISLYAAYSKTQRAVRLSQLQHSNSCQTGMLVRTPSYIADTLVSNSKELSLQTRHQLTEHRREQLKENYEMTTSPTM